jgi:hypothetical protein
MRAVAIVVSWALYRFGRTEYTSPIRLPAIKGTVGRVSNRIECLASDAPLLELYQ